VSKRSCGKDGCVSWFGVEERQMYGSGFWLIRMYIFSRISGGRSRKWKVAWEAMLSARERMVS